MLPVGNLIFSVRVVTEELLVQDDLWWSIGSYGGRKYDVLGESEAVPEPMTMSLLGLGACLPLFRRKTR